MGVNAEGKISLSVELQNFKDIAGSLKKGLSEELKQVPLDVQFNNKDLEKKAAAALRDINEMFSKTRLKNLDFSSILPAFINEINKGDISDEIRYQVIEGFRTGLNNLKIAGATTQNYSKIKGFDSENLLKYFSDVNDVEDILDSFKGLSKRQKQGLRTSVLPSLSELKGRGWDTADKEYTKGAKRLDAILQLSSQYGDVVQYGTNPTATKDIIKELDKRFKEGNASKIDAEDLIGYLLRSNFLNIDLKELDIDSNYLLKESKNILGDKADKIENALKERTQLYFMAYDEIFNSSAAKVDFSDISKGLTNTTNKRLQSVYNAEVPENEKIKVGKLFKETVKIKSDEKPELRNDKTIKENEKQFSKKRQKSEDNFKKENEKEIKDYDTEIQRLEQELNELDVKLDELSDKATLLKKEIPQEEKTLNDLNTQIDNKQTGIETRKNRDSKRLNNLNERKEVLENQSKDIDANLEKLQKRKEELANKITALRKEEYDLYHVPEEQENQWYAKTAEESYIEDVKRNKLIPQQLNLTADEEALNRTYEAITSKRELQKLLKEKLEEIKSINKEIHDLFEQTEDETLNASERNEANILMQDKMDVRSRLNLDYSKIYRQAIKQGVNEKTLNKYYNEGLELSDLVIENPHYSLGLHDKAIQDNIEIVEEQVERRKERIQQIKDEIEEEEKELAEIIQKLNGFDLDKIKERRNKIPEEQKAIEKEIEKTNNEIFDQEFAKKRNISLLKGTQIDIDELQAEDNTKSEKELQQLQQLKEQRDRQKKIYDEKKQANDELLKQMEQVDKQMDETRKRRDILIQKQKEAKEKQEELDRQEAQDKQTKANKKKTNDSEANSDFENEEPQSSKDSGTTGNTSTSTSIPPEQLQKVLTLLDSIQKTLGTLEDGSDIPSITQSVKDMADALKELSSVLGEIKQKDFNLNIGLPNNNPIGQQGEAKRKILKELEQQYNELNSYFANKYGGDSEAVNALRKYEGGSKYVYSLMEDYPIASDKGESLNNRIESYKTLVEQLRSFLIQEGGELNKVLSNVLSPEEIINKITDDIAKFNPTTALQNIFEEMKISIDASLAQINTESKGFSFLSGSAEEAAEAKRKFVEANKDVFQSIIASAPKIEQEANALEKVKEAQNKSSTKISKTESEKEKDRKRYFDFESMPNDLIEQRYNEISPFPVIPKGASLATDRLNDEVHIAMDSVELLEELHTAWDRSQQEIKDIIYDSTIENMQKEYAESQRPVYDFEPDYEDLARQAQEARQYYEEQISNDFEVKVETQLDLKQDETGQLSLFDNVLPEENWGQEVETKTNNISEAAIKGQISFQQLQEAIENSERAFAKLSSSKNTSGKSFLQNTDIPNDVLEKYENISTTLGKGYEATGNLQELKNLSNELTDVKTKLKASFDETGNLKSTVDPFEVQNLLSKYDELINKIQNLKAAISSPTSEENMVLKIAKDAEKAQIKIDKSTQQIEEKLNNLKQKIDTTLGKSNLFEAQTEKTINTYGAFNGEEGQRTDLITSDKLGEKYGDRFAKQQEQVQQLIDKLRDYRTAIKELEALRTSDDTTLEQLTEANDKVKNLKDSITNLSQTIKTSGIANVSEEQLGTLKNRFEIFLEKNPNLTSGIKQQIQEYINILNSGASVSKTRYASMTADLNKFAAAQTSGRTIWEQMVGKMREGIAFLATKFSFYEIFNQFRQGFEVIHQFDDALTEMMKVSDETRLSLERYQKTTFDTADAIGTSALQIQNSTADFMRLGETLNEAAESAKTANILMNVSEFQSIDEATKSLIAMSAAYDDLSKMNIIDKLNEVGNNYAISTSEAAEALQSSASALKTAGNDIDEALALITAGNAVVQDANKVGTGMRTIALRLTGKTMCPNIE